MTVEEFTSLQYDQGGSALPALLRQCMRRFRLAGNLVGIAGPIFKKLRDAEHEGHVDLTPLYPAWRVTCDRYRRERFNLQPSLFKEHGDEARELWGQFLYWELFPHLLREDEFVRNVLRATGLLPCRTQQQAASALSHHLEEMSLPFGRPIWDPADIENED